MFIAAILCIYRILRKYVFLATTALEGRKAAAQTFCQANETGILIEVKCRAALQGLSLEMLELYDRKLSRTVLRRYSGREARDLSDW